MSITFDSIPSDIRTFGQYIEVNNTRAVQGLPLRPNKALLIGQRLSTGTVAEAVPTLIPSASLAETYFGIGSHIAAMAAAFKKANPYTELWGVALDDNVAGTQGTQTLTLSGTATADGTIYLYIAGHRITLAVSSGDAAAAVSTALDAAIKAYKDYSRLPVSSGEAASVVTLTARNDGTLGNAVDVRINYQQGEFLPAGIGLAIATGVSGASDPDVQDALDAIPDTQYHTIASAFYADAALEAIAADLATKFGPMVQKEGMCFAAAPGTLSALSSSGNGLNHAHLSVLSIGGVADNSPTTPWEAAATVAAVRAYQISVDPARPRQTLILPGVLPPPEADQFPREDRQTLLTDGISTTYVDAGGSVRIERLITTYQTNALGVADTSYLDETTMATLAALRYDFRARIALKYPRHKLADDGTLFDPGQAIVTPSSIRSELISLFRDWEAAGLVENFDQFKEDLIVERNASDPNRIDVLMSPDLINQFRVLAGQVQFIL